MRGFYRDGEVTEHMKRFMSIAVESQYAVGREGYGLYYFVYLVYLQCINILLFLKMRKLILGKLAFGRHACFFFFFYFKII